MSKKRKKKGREPLPPEEARELEEFMREWGARVTWRLLYLVLAEASPEECERVLREEAERKRLADSYGESTWELRRGFEDFRREQGGEP